MSPSARFAYFTGENITYGYDNNSRITAITATHNGGASFFTRAISYTTAGTDRTYVQSESGTNIT